MRRLRPPFLPDRCNAGWTPYAWLIYLASFYIGPIAQTRAGAAEWWLWPATVLGTIVFLLAYFRAHWVRGRRLVRMAAVQVALGILFAPINAGSAVFFVYGASFVAQLDRTRHAVRGVGLIAALGGIMSFFTQAPLFFAAVSVGITLVVSGVNLHYARESRTLRKLRLAHEEIEQLAAIAERERIARDLHDVLGHTLSLIVLKAELAVKLSAIDPQRASVEMRDVEQVARTTLQDVRRAIRGYRTTLAEELDRARAMLKAAHIDAVVDARHGELSGAVEETLSLALREAVTNVVRHSDASRCTIRTAVRDGRVMLEVVDDGRGLGGAPGLGLRGMSERVESLGGSITLASDGGARIAIALPAGPPSARAPSPAPAVAVR